MSSAARPTHSNDLDSIGDAYGGNYIALEDDREIMQRSKSKYDSDLTVNSVDAYNQSFIAKSGKFATAFLVGYFIISILAATFWFNFPILDAVYFSVVTFSTVGYGDFVPKTLSTRLFQAFLILLGVGVGSSLIGILNDQINTFNETTAERRSIETTEKLQELIAAGVDLQKRKYHNIKSGISVLHLKQEEDVEEGNNQAVGRKPSFRKTEDPNEVSLEQLSTILRSQYEAEFKHLNHSVVVNVAVVIALITIGALGMSTIEGWKAEDAIYWSTVTLSTIGYGDLVPTTDAGKVFTIFFIVSCVAFMAKTITDIAKFPVLRRNRRSEFHFIKQFSRKLSKEQLVSIFESKFFNIYPRMRRVPDVLHKAEFSLLALHMMNKISTKDLLVVSRLFDSMDTLKEGLLTKETMDLEVATAKTEAEILQEERQSESHTVRTSLTDRITRMVSGASKHETEGEPIPLYARRSMGSFSNAGPVNSNATGVTSPLSGTPKERDGSLYTASMAHSPLLNQPLMNDTIDNLLSDGWKSAPSNPRQSGHMHPIHSTDSADKL